MSNNKKTQNKRIRPKGFIPHNTIGRFNMTVDELEEHYTQAIEIESRQYRKYKEFQEYAAVTANLLETKKILERGQLND